MSKETYSSLHMWKKVLYWMVERPGWCRKLQNMKVLGSFFLKLPASLAILSWPRSPSASFF
jgi:hypothetical protein